MQNYQNYRRFHAPFHFILAPFLILHFIYTIVRLVQDPTVDRVDYALLALALCGILVLARINALKVQDRIIRLEEQFRYSRVLPADLAFQAENLPLKQILALRFASDAELNALIEQVLGGNLQKPGEIKRAVQNWRADELRV